MHDTQAAQAINNAGRIEGVKPPDTWLARKAVTLVQSVSTPALFNHVMRSYCFAELLSANDAKALDRESLFYSSVLHDLGLTPHAAGGRRFELEGAGAAFAFLIKHGFPQDDAWKVWDCIALHTTDLNQYRQIEAQAFQRGILADVLGVGLESVPQPQVELVLAGFPRLGFKREFTSLLMRDAERKPASFAFHPAVMIAHHCLGGVDIPDARSMIAAAPFDE